jgi:hypothetical protein
MKEDTWKGTEMGVGEEKKTRKTKERRNSKTQSHLGIADPA